MAKVLVSDKLAPQGLEILERAPGLEVDYRPGLAPEALLEAIREADGLVIRSGTRVTAEVLDAAEKLPILSGRSAYSSSRCASASRSMRPSTASSTTTTSAIDSRHGSSLE